MSMRARMPDVRSTLTLKDALPLRSRVLIMTHDYPDPDALASAAALHLLLDRAYHVRSTILFTGVVSRAENQELLRHFRYRWRFTEDFQPPARWQPAIFLDVWPGSGNITVPPWARPIGVMDHHPPPTRMAPEGWFVDVRPGLGATVTILYEQLREADVNVPPWLAAIMAYAIETETLAFTRLSTPEDRAAYIALMSHANLRIIGAIRHAPLPRAHFSRLQEAIANARLYVNVAWTHLPEADPPELIAEVADLLARIERVTWSFCTGERGDQLLVSVRGDRRDARCGRIVREAIGGDGQGGGHDRMAAGFVSLTGLTPEQRDERLRRLQTALLRRMIPKKLPTEDADLDRIGRTLV